MNKFQQYCELLDVEPGADAKLVRKNFHERIKDCHPDSAKQDGDQKKAQILIEAYNEFKNGVPQVHTQKSAMWGKQYAQTTSQEAFWKEPAQAQKGHTSAEHNGNASAHRMFETFRKTKPSHSPSHSFANFLADMENELYATNEEDSMWECHYSPSRSNVAVQPQAKQDTESGNFQSAELILRKTVRSFESSSYRLQRNWAREFIGELAQIQVVYRDVCRFTPTLTYRALQRIRQISELIAEIRRCI